MAALADKDYHGGVPCFDPLTIKIIKNCGYTAINSDDIILCYRDIMLLHRKTLEGWTNIRTQQSGPSVERIMEKAMTLFEKLEGITTTDFVHFYDTFQKTGSVYLLPFMPFNAVSLKLGFEGLCPPGLGIDCYAAIAAALMEVIPCLLPAHIARCLLLLQWFGQTPIMVMISCGNYLLSPYQDSTPLNMSRHWCGRTFGTYSISAMRTFYIFASRQKGACITTSARVAPPF
jgi:hypothetical protein